MKPNWHIAHTLPCICWLLTVALNMPGRVVRLRNGTHRVNVAISGHSTDLPRSCARCRLYPHAFTSGEAQLTLLVLTSRRSVALLVAHAHKHTFVFLLAIQDHCHCCRCPHLINIIHALNHTCTQLPHTHACVHTRSCARASVAFFLISKSSTTQSVCTRSAQRASSKSTSTS